MTPFGIRLRQLREKRSISQKQMAQDMGVSAAYLSALEHGKRGSPSFHFVQRIITYFNVIWDEADELIVLSKNSHPRIMLDTSGLSVDATKLAHHLSHNIHRLSNADIAAITQIINQTIQT